MKYQKIIQAKNNIAILIEKAEENLADLKYKAECITQTLLFLDQCDVTPHKPGRSVDNGKRKKQARGLSNEILDILSVDPKPASSNEIHHCLTETEKYEHCTINSVTGLLCFMTQDGKLGRIKQGNKFHYFINKEV